MHDEFTYWSRRAEQHAICAINATSDVVADIHDRMVWHYTRRALGTLV